MTDDNRTQPKGNRLDLPRNLDEEKTVQAIWSWVIGDGSSESLGPCRAKRRTGIIDDKRPRFFIVAGAAGLTRSKSRARIHRTNIQHPRRRSIQVLFAPSSASPSGTFGMQSCVTSQDDKRRRDVCIQQRRGGGSSLESQLHNRPTHRMAPPRPKSRVTFSERTKIVSSRCQFARLARGKSPAGVFGEVRRLTCWPPATTFAQPALHSSALQIA